jgi:DNA invertase Pin-like site-specific DNA recombinase
MKLVAYLRISNIENNDLGHRITNQRKVVRDAANAAGHRIVKVFAD